MFSLSSVASSVFNVVVCWGAAMKVKNLYRINKQIRKAESVVGIKLAPLEEVTRERRLEKIRAIKDNAFHPPYSVVDSLRSRHSQRSLQPRCVKKCHSKSFLPETIKLIIHT